VAYAITLDGNAGEVTIREGENLSFVAPAKRDLVWVDEAAPIDRPAGERISQQDSRTWADGAWAVDNGTEFEFKTGTGRAALSPEVQKRYEENLARAKEFVSRPFGKVERLGASGRQAGKIQALVSAAEVQKQFAKHLYPMPGQNDITQGNKIIEPSQYYKEFRALLAVNMGVEDYELSAYMRGKAGLFSDAKSLADIVEDQEFAKVVATRHAALCEAGREINEKVMKTLAEKMFPAKDLKPHVMGLDAEQLGEAGDEAVQKDMTAWRTAVEDKAHERFGHGVKVEHVPMSEILKMVPPGKTLNDFVAKPESTEPHIMGLDAESIDPEAFKAFGKTL